MVSLVYISSAVQLFSAAELVALLEKSRTHNDRLGLTGMLLYKDGNFIQVLEGEDDAVECRMSIIAADPRHRGIIRLLKRTIEQRHFVGWSMGYANLKDVELRDVPGFSEFADVALDADSFVSKPNQAVKLLHIFKRNV